MADPIPGGTPDPFEGLRDLLDGIDPVERRRLQEELYWADVRNVRDRLDAFKGSGESLAIRMRQQGLGVIGMWEAQRNPILGKAIMLDRHGMQLDMVGKGETEEYAAVVAETIGRGFFHKVREGKGGLEVDPHAISELGRVEADTDSIAEVADSRALESLTPYDGESFSRIDVERVIAGSIGRELMEDGAYLRGFEHFMSHYLRPFHIVVILRDGHVVPLHMGGL